MHLQDANAKPAEEGRYVVPIDVPSRVDDGVHLGMKVADGLQPVRVILDGVWIVALALGWIRIDPVPVVFELGLAAPLQFTFEGIALLVEGRVGGNQIDRIRVERSEDGQVVAEVERIELEIRRLWRTIVRGGGGG